MKQNHSHNRHRWPLILLLVVLALLLADAGLAKYFLDYALKTDRPWQSDNGKMLRHQYKVYPELRPWIDSLKQAHALRDTFVTMPDGERNHAYYVRAGRPTPCTAVVIHGYKRCAMKMLPQAWIYHHLMGYNILLPDNHAHGLSPGRYIQMGWKDRLDALRWTEVASRLFADSTGQARIVVHGVSMGAATTMALSGEKTPQSVRAFIEDCGYSSVDDEFRYEMSELFGLPAFPILPSASLLCRLQLGWSFGEANMLRQVERCTKPMLFIHGTRDHFVPTRMVYPLYRAKRGPKAIFLAKGSAHDKSYDDHRAEYAARVKAFCRKYVAQP